MLLWCCQQHGWLQLGSLPLPARAHTHHGCPVVAAVTMTPSGQCCRQLLGCRRHSAACQTAAHTWMGRCCWLAHAGAGLRRRQRPHCLQAMSACSRAAAQQPPLKANHPSAACAARPGAGCWLLRQCCRCPLPRCQLLQQRCCCLGAARLHLWRPHRSWLAAVGAVVAVTPTVATQEDADWAAQMAEVQSALLAAPSAVPAPSAALEAVAPLQQAPLQLPAARLWR